MNLPILEKPSRRRHYILFSMVLSAIVLLFFLALPHTAHADPLGISDAIQNSIKDIVTGSVNFILEMVGKATNFFNAKDALDAPFNAILTRDNGVSGAYKTIEGMQKSVTIIGQSILALALLVQLVKISQRVDGNATMPVVKEIVILAVFFVVGSYLVNHSFDICAAAYDEINKLTSAIVNGKEASTFAGLKMDPNKPIDDLGGFVVCLVVWVIVLLFSMIGSVLALALVMARAIQLYVMAACSPIPLSLLLFDETKQIGIGFCKSFLAVCLAGTILAILITIYPALIGDILRQNAVQTDGGVWLINVASIVEIIPILACSVMYIFALIKSGSWARDILGG